MTKRKKFLDAAAVDATIEEIVTKAASLRIPVALCGGAAMQLYGSDRLTVDVDLVVGRARPSLLAKRLKTLSFGGIRGQARTGVEVDLIERDDQYRAVYQKALRHRVRVAGVPVVSIEYLALFKMIASREKDDLDLRFLLAHAMTAAQRKHAVELARKLLGDYAADDLLSFIREALWRKQSEPR
jgi:hypothetical protein